LALDMISSALPRDKKNPKGEREYCNIYLIRIRRPTPINRKAGERWSISPAVCWAARLATRWARRLSSTALI